MGSRIRAFSACDTGEEGEEGRKEERKEEQKAVEEQVIPASLAAQLAAMHASLSSSSHPSPFGRPSETDRFEAAATALDPSAWSLLPYVSPAQWYLKREADGFGERGHLLRWRDLCAYGRVTVTTSVYAFRKISKLTSKIIDKQEISMPLHTLETYAAWVDVPPSVQRAFEAHAAKEFQDKCRQRIEAEAATKTGQMQWRGETAAELASAKRAKRENGSSAAAAASAASASSSDGIGPAELLDSVSRNNLQDHSIHAGLHGLTHCMISLLPIFLLCDGGADIKCDCPSVFELRVALRAHRAPIAGS